LLVEREAESCGEGQMADVIRERFCGRENRSALWSMRPAIRGSDGSPGRWLENPYPKYMVER